jgi:type II secretory pathway pseudopilin PulG
MVVISIMGLLVMLLVPVVASARLIVAKAATTNKIKQISTGLETFKVDFGEYPPSRPSWQYTTTAERKQCGMMFRGAANLAWYLAGPGGNGWGIDAAGRMPYDGRDASGTSLYTAVSSVPTRSYGPYYKATREEVAWEDASGSTTPGSTPVMGAILDAFGPPGKILYFRYEANPIDPATNKPRDNYQVSDNDYTSGGAGGDLTAKKNVSDQAKFLELIALPMGKDNKGNTIYRYVRADYLLISPGADGVYGWVKKDETTGLPIPVSRTEKVAMGCDDVTNW